MSRVLPCVLEVRRLLLMVARASKTDVIYGERSGRAVVGNEDGDPGGCRILSRFMRADSTDEWNSA